MCTLTSRSARAARYGAQRGIALVAVLLALLVVTILGLALNAFGVLSVNIATNERQGTEALYVADAGVSHARRMLMQMIANPPVLPLPGTSVMDQFLTRGDGQPCNGDELAPAPPAPFVAGDAIPMAGVVFPPGSANNYRVAVCDDDGQQPQPLVENGSMLIDTNDAILVRVFGTGQNSATSAVEITITRVELPGLLVDGNLNISGNPSVTGFGGAIHANGGLQIDGTNPCADDYISATGTITADPKGKTGNCPAGSDSPSDKRPGAARIDVPPIRPADFRAQADFLLGNDGVIRNQAGVPIVPPPGGWNWDPGGRRWFKGDNAITNGAYYADNQPSNGPDGIANTPDDTTNIEISGNPNGTVTLIATGYINISGNPGITPDLLNVPVPNYGTVNISMLAGTDLKIKGTPGTLYQGVHYAGHQIEVEGNPTVNGQLIADNQCDFNMVGCVPPDFAGDAFYSNLVLLDSTCLAGPCIKISGNPTINVNAAGLLASLNQTGWRECRPTNPVNPADPCQ